MHTYDFTSSRRQFMDGMCADGPSKSFYRYAIVSPKVLFETRVNIFISLISISCGVDRYWHGCCYCIVLNQVYF